MSGKGSWTAASLVAAASLLAGVPALAQQSPVGGAELDPSAPLDPMPDLGVEWPDLDTPDPVQGETAAETAFEQALADPVDELSAERRYRVVSGLDAVTDPTLAERFEQLSVLQGDRGQAANAAQLDRRARADAELLAELLRAEGYYDAAVEPRVEAGAEAVLITLAAQPGALYRFTAVELPGLDAAAGEDAEALRRAFSVRAGDPVDAAQVTAAGLALQQALGQRGFALAKVGEQDIVIDHETRTARLVLTVEPGAFQRFGQIRVSGDAPFDAAHVADIARLEPKERFRQSRVDDLRRALIATGLVSTAEVRVVPAADGRTVDLDVRLGSAPPRTIAGELGYGTGEGLRAEASWQHRNFFRPEGALTLRAVAGTQEQLAGASVRFNNWRGRDRVLSVSASASHVDRDAFEARTLQLLGTLERQSNFLWHKRWTWSLGGELLATDERDVDLVTDGERRRTFFIAAAPVSLLFDGSDDLLDPTRGFRLGGRLSPELSLQGGAFGYARMQLDASAYRPLSNRVVAAGRVRLGTIVGSSRDRIAPSRRFYSGGGGSVRGYGYQRLGPRDGAGHPIGGRSLAEFSLEARVRFGNFGVVPFVDAGTLSTGALPRLSDWQVGTGVGLRYYSSFGPIRLDVGAPLNRRQGDSRVAVTVSLGQAF
jgi:translocation and assembly module TamA